MSVRESAPGMPRVAEFFAGIGLVREALHAEGMQVVWANDIMQPKRAVYAENFGDSHFRFGDIRQVRGRDLPTVDLATASFPCTDLSLAGNRAGLKGQESGMFWEFARVLGEVPRKRRPKAVLLENVVGFATSRGGQDLKAAIAQLNDLGYWCDVFVLDARRFVPQSRPRMFIVGSRDQVQSVHDGLANPIRPSWVASLASENPELKLHSVPLPSPPEHGGSIDAIVERMDERDPRWWRGERKARFEKSLSPIQRRRLRSLQEGGTMRWATAYRRTRAGSPVWEIRADDISGCLRTARGGSSKQAVVEAGDGRFRVRWMTAREYARLQGADDLSFSSVTEGQALFGFGDAVCVPVIRWIARHYLAPLISGRLGRNGRNEPRYIAYA